MGALLNKLIRLLLVGLALFVVSPASTAVAAAAESCASGSVNVANNFVSDATRLSDEAVGENAALDYDLASDDAVAARAGSKVALPSLKSSRFGSKIADDLPDGVPRNWSKTDIEDAIVDFNTSLASRRRELAAFDAVGGGSPGLRRGHAQRITQEQAFLKSLEKALGR